MMNLSIVFLVILPLFPIMSAEETPVAPGNDQEYRCMPRFCNSTNALDLSGFPGTLPGKCGRKQTLQINFIADDTATLFVCGNLVSFTETSHQTLSLSYNGRCDDLMIWLTNISHLSSVSVLIYWKGKKYGTTDATGKYRKLGTIPLHGIITFKPKAGFFNNPDDFPFNTWMPAVVIQSLLRPNADYAKLTDQGAFPIGYINTNTAAGVYGLKIRLPFCK